MRIDAVAFTALEHALVEPYGDAQGLKNTPFRVFQ